MIDNNLYNITILFKMKINKKLERHEKLHNTTKFKK